MADGGGERLGVFDLLLDRYDAADRRLEDHDNGALAVFEGQERALVVQDVENPLLRIEEKTALHDRAVVEHEFGRGLDLLLELVRDANIRFSLPW